MLNDIQETTLSHVTDLKTLSGTVKSYWRPFDLKRKILFTEIMSYPLRGYVDCEDCIEALVDYIRKATGKAIRMTAPMRTLLVHMYSLHHQYKDGGLVSMSTVFAGYKKKDPLNRLRKLLEEAGLIKMESGEWVYNPANRQRNRAPKYRFTPEFTALLGLIHMSYAKGKASGQFALNDTPIKNVSIRSISEQYKPNAKSQAAPRQDNDRTQTDQTTKEPSHLIDKPADARTSRPIIRNTRGTTLKHSTNDETLSHDTRQETKTPVPIIEPGQGAESSRSTPDKGQGNATIRPIIRSTREAASETVENQGVTRRVMPAYERRMRDKKLEKLWKGMTLAAMKKAGLDQKCRLQCVSLGMGAEVDDFTFISIMAKHYREDLYAKIVREDDAALPVYIKDPTSGNRVTTTTYWSFGPERDKYMNITKAGVRPYSELCGTRNDMDNPNIVLKPSETSRKAVMDALNLPYHFDVHCSIHNLGRALKTGKFENTDIYSRVASHMNASRNDVKLAFMHACFGPLAEYCAKYPESKKANQYIHHKDKETKEDRIFPFTYRQIQDAMKAEQVPINGRYTEIFWHEAFIFDLVRLYLRRERGIVSTRVYDSFYTREEIDETEFISLINRAVTDYLHILAHNDHLLSISL